MARQSAEPQDEAVSDPEHGDLEDLVGYNLKRAYVIVSADFRRALGEDGFSPRVYAALSLIIQYPNVTQSALARKLGIERSGLVAIIDELETRGFVMRQPVPGDRRIQALAPTSAGQGAYSHARDVVRRHEAALLSGLSREETETLVGLLQKIRKLGT